jgi:cytochrome c
MRTHVDASMALALSVALMAVLTASDSGDAQNQPDPRKGLELARGLCASCHAVEPGNRRSIRPAAPAFSMIASTRGMSAAALSSALQTSHREMPDIVLAPGERADIIAYILSLETR